MVEINLIDKNTILTKDNTRYVDWDVYVNDKPYDVYRVEGFVHTIGGNFGENNYWCCPHGEVPTYENLIQFNGNPCRWGFRIEERNYIKTKWDETEVRRSCVCTITRNGKDFYDFGAGINYAAAKAMKLIMDISEHPADFNIRDFERKLLGRKVYWREQPAVIARYIEGQACVILIPESEEGFKNPCYMDEGEEMEDKFAIKEDMFSKSIYWFRK